MADDAFDLQGELLELAAECEYDPELFVREAFPWGEGELAGKEGPREWQLEILRDISERLRSNRIGAYEAIQEAVASGHGIGKSALVAWLVLWAMCTREDTKGVVTANTENQLKTKTWAEIAKWCRLCVFKSWFVFTATALFSADKDREKTWRIDMVPWSERNTEAFAGLHNEGKRILLIFDEASAIPDVIWEVAEGALTDEDTEIIWCAFGNPTRNTGRFRECFGRLRHRWNIRQIDSRTVPGTNKKQMQAWVDDYGEDSDFVRVRVRGVFPRAGSAQFVPSDVVMDAMEREAACNESDPLIMGVDVARFGDDQSVIRFRRGRDARTIKPAKYRGIDTMQLAAYVAEAATKHKPDAILVDGGGVGGGVIDRLRQLGWSVIEVNFASKPPDDECANLRAYMWREMREWLKTGGAIENDRNLEADLTGVEYGFNQRNQLQLEKKEDMKKRGLASPDDGDSLAITFAVQIGPKGAWNGGPVQAKSGFKVF